MERKQRELVGTGLDRTVSLTYPTLLPRNSFPYICGKVSAFEAETIRTTQGYAPYRLSYKDTMAAASLSASEDMSRLNARTTFTGPKD